MNDPNRVYIDEPELINEIESDVQAIAISTVGFTLGNEQVHALAHTIHDQLKAKDTLLYTGVLCMLQIGAMRRKVCAKCVDIFRKLI